VPTRSVDDLFKWEKEKKLRLMEKSIENENREDKCRFTPELSKHSRALLKKKTNQKEFEKVEDRLMSYLKVKAKEPEEAGTHRGGKSPRAKGGRARSKSRGVRPLQLKAEDNVMCFTLQETDEAESQGFKMAVQKVEVGCDRELCFSFKKDRHVSGGFKAFQTDSMQSHQSRAEGKKESLQLPESPKKGERVFKPAAKCRDSREGQTDVVLSATELNSIIQANKLNKKKNNHDKIEQKENINQQNTKPPKTEKSIQERTPLKEKANEAKTGGKGLKTSIVDKINKAKVVGKEAKPEPKKGSISAVEPRVEPRAGHKALDKEASKLKKTEMVEKYGVKVRKQEIDTAEIQESFVGGGTSSMLNNLKRINQHLKKFNDCPSIIKEAKGGSQPGPSTQPVVLDSAVVQSNVYLQKFQAVAGARPGEPARADQNPFLTLFEKSHAKV
jgi:hypothetical protein